MNRSQTVTINGKNIFYILENIQYYNKQSDTLVFLHEGLGSSAQWKDFPLAISNELKIPVLTYDRYGYGKSDEMIEDRKADYLELEAKVYLKALLEKLNIAKNTILFGHSDGGTIALLFAAMFPEMLKGIITEAAHVYYDELTTEGVKMINESYTKYGLREKLLKYHGNKIDSVINSWNENLLLEMSQNWNIEHFLHKITCPSLIIQGVNDNYGTFQQVIDINRQVSGYSEILKIEECGHIPHQEAEEIVFEKTINFIKENVLDSYLE